MVSPAPSVPTPLDKDGVLSPPWRRKAKDMQEMVRELRAAESPAVTAALLERGYSEEDLAKIWGGNLLRVMREVQAAAAE